LKANVRDHPITEEQVWKGCDFELFKYFGETKKRIHKHFCNNFSTPDVIHEIDELISYTNVYMAKNILKYPIVNSIGDYIVFIFKCIGVVYEYKAAGSQGKTNQNAEEIADPYMKVLSDFRIKVRDAAKAKDLTEVLRVCDEVRDDILPNLGVRLEDKGKEGSIWKYEDKEILLKERDEKQNIEKKKLEEKLKKQEEAARKKTELEEKSKIAPSELFIHQTNLYSKFDDKGVPTHDLEGKEVSKNLAKKLKKEYDTQEELHKV